MAATLLGLPYELRERILMPCLRQRGTIEIQYPVWADKAVFTHPLTQVCRQLRDESIPMFYRANVFVWVIDTDEDGRPDPTMYPLRLNVSREGGPSGSLVSPFPWYYPQTVPNLRHLRLNLYLPTSSDNLAWTEKFPARLAHFVAAIDHGKKLKDLRVLIGTWYHHTAFLSSQTAVFDILDKMQVRGRVHLRTSNIYNSTRDFICKLGLATRMSDRDSLRSSKGDQPDGHLDWAWEGGANADGPAAHPQPSDVGPG